MHIFATNHVVAKSRFWAQMNKMKKSSEEIVHCAVRPEAPLRVKNFAVWLHYNSQHDTHNMCQEYRDLTAAGAVKQCYQDTGAPHCARAHSINLMKVEEISEGKCRRPAVKQFLGSEIRFLLPHRVLQRQHTTLHYK
ncbi:60S ribosomal protein L18a-like isoform X1 [Cricetulus griseus]|uniref:Large ribosomal subunit protein eL20 n=1 Tax=Cricetulus griseus TaxID=10029 RepID=G3GXA4_CRIGR|nr:60S ribosomal protein L18a-like isoform X1 [Cricetulus griseus]EGW06201.1 60S ribosomal protein L18a [Cricetulus griseus]